MALFNLKKLKDTVEKSADGIKKSVSDDERYGRKRPKYDGYPESQGR